MKFTGNYFLKKQKANENKTELEAIPWRRNTVIFVSFCETGPRVVAAFCAEGAEASLKEV